LILQEEKVFAFREPNCLSGCNGFLFIEIACVSNDHCNNIAIGILAWLPEPPDERIECEEAVMSNRRSAPVAPRMQADVIAL
jgi:hypothetical protein